MSEHTDRTMEKLDIQFIEREGHKEYAVLKYDDFIRLVSGKKSRAGAGYSLAEADGLAPSEVVKAHAVDGVPLLRAWREHRKLTQAHVAHKLGISQSAFSQLEKSGTDTMRLNTLRRVAKALGLKVVSDDKG